jgi:group I intron endonuclease
MKGECHMTGIYAIENIATGEVYVDQSRNIPNRYQQHLSMLECGEHHSIKLQKAYNSVGAVGFMLKILELCDESELDRKEQEWIQKLDAYDKGYNMRNQTGMVFNLDSFYPRVADTLHKQFRTTCKELGLAPTEAIQMLIDREIEESKRNVELLQTIREPFEHNEDGIVKTTRTVRTVEEKAERVFTADSDYLSGNALKEAIKTAASKIKAESNDEFKILQVARERGELISRSNIMDLLGISEWNARMLRSSLKVKFKKMGVNVK